MLQASELFQFAFTTQLLHSNSFRIKCDLLVVDLWVIGYSCPLFSISSCFIIHPALLTVYSLSTDIFIFNLWSSPFELLKRTCSLNRRKFQSCHFVCIRLHTKSCPSCYSVLLCQNLQLGFRMYCHILSWLHTFWLDRLAWQAWIFLFELYPCWLMQTVQINFTLLHKLYPRLWSCKTWRFCFRVVFHKFFTK